MAFRVPEKYRVRSGAWATNAAEHGNNGMFWIPRRGEPLPLRVLASDGAGAVEHGFEAWEHVSISLPIRCPIWAEMCQVKELFWDAEDTVMQLHPPKSEWISNHPFCLHLWRPVAREIPRPPAVYVGDQSFGERL